MTDPDDVVAFMLPYALQDLWRVASRYPDPDLVIQEWFLMCASVFIAGTNQPSFHEVLLLCARRVAAEAKVYAPDPPTAA